MRLAKDLQVRFVVAVMVKVPVVDTKIILCPADLTPILLYHRAIGAPLYTTFPCVVTLATHFLRSALYNLTRALLAEPVTGRRRATSCYGKSSSLLR
jgi:hypothetical protein